MKSYPETFLRGLQDNSVSDSGYVISEAFKFNTNKERTVDDRLELSVNWEDNNEAVDILLSQTKEGKDGKEHLQFKRGFSRLHLREVKQILKALVDKNDFGYERRPLESNPYHGNLLQNPNLKPAEVRLLSNSLAAIANNSVYLRDSGDNPYLDMKIELMERKEEIKNPQISVIVPVYNVEKYLHKCVDSILKQTLSDIELILVDDGSPDGSGAICDEYAQKDSRVKVIHKPNGGVSSARNAGIEVARGEWLCFVDSDDYIDETYLEDFGVDKGDADMYMQGYVELSPEKDVLAEHQMTCKEDSCLTDVIAESEDLRIINSPCFKLYKSSFILDNNIKFDKELSYGEDHVFSLEYLQYVNKIAVCRKMGYIVNRGRCDSLTRSFVPFDKMLYYIVKTEDLQKSIIDRYPDPELRLRKAINRRRYSSVNKIVYDGFYGGMSGDKLQEVKDLINSLTFQDVKGIGLKHTLFLIIVKMLPYSLLTRIFRRA